MPSVLERTRQAVEEGIKAIESETQAETPVVTESAPAPIIHEEQTPTPTPQEHGTPPLPASTENDDTSLSAEVERLRAENLRLETSKKVLEGKYGAEVPRYAQENRDLKRQLAELEASKPFDAEKFKKDHGLTDEEAEFTPEFLSAVDKVTTAKVSKITSENREVLEQAKDQGYRVTLSEQCPEWKALNADRGFLDWLQQSDPVFGVPRQKALDRAYDAYDAAGSASIFKEYLKTKSTPSVTPASSDPKPSDYAGVRPAGAPNVSTQQTTKPKTYTSTEISQMATQIARGAVKGEEAVRVKKEIDAAILEGRVT